MSLQKSLGWMAMAQAVSIFLQFGSSVVLARLLIPHEFGVFAVALAVSGVLAIIQNLGLQALIVREPELTDELSRTAFTVNGAIAIVLSILIALASLLGGHLLQEDGVRRVLLAIAVTPLFTALSFLPAAQLERRGRFRELALAGIVAGAISAVVTVIAAARGASFMSFAYGQWAQTLTFAAAVCMFGRAYVNFRPGFGGWRRVAEFGFQMFAVSGVSTVSGKLSELILARILGLSALGLYTRAASLNGLIWTNIHLVLGRVLLVDFSEILRRGESLRGRYIRTVDITTAVLWPAFLGLAIIAKPFIVVLYGPTWVPAALPLALIAIASFVQVAITMTWELFACTGELRTQTKIEVIRSVLALVVFAIACTISLEAAAAARVLDACIAYAMYRGHVNRMTDTTTRDFLPIYARNLLLSLAAVGPSLALMAAHGFSAEVPLSQVAASIVAGILLWGVGLAALSHPLFEELRSSNLLRRGRV